MDIKKLEAVYDQALGLSESERRAYLDRIRDEDPELAQAFERLVENTGIDDEFLKQPIEAMAAGLAEGMKDPWIGRELGAYCIAERIAAGGMGTVYLAKRSDEQFEHTVAIKFLTAGLAADALTSRFLSERQILAQLNHPNVAKLLDGGTTDTGVPYLVMEFIEGLPVDEFCEQNQLDTRQRLQLFQKICAAVQYAHQNLVIHRDIKVSNILVQKNGEPKLLDFGIAKITDPSVPGHTRAEMRVLTPQSASPEQITGGAISTATDVYALGLLLYRLLTGQYPFHVEGEEPRDVYDAVLKTEPFRPSGIVTSSPEKRADSSAQRLRKELVGDLDTIILTALRKEPERRYGTVRQFSEDIDNYLNDRPVMARRDSLSYRMGKFARRHRLPIAAGVVGASVLIALITFYTLQLADERDRALLAADKSAEVSSFLTSLFRSSSPFQVLGDDPSVIDVLDRGIERADALSEQPLLQASLNRVMARSLFYLGEYERASQLFEKTISQLRTTPESDPQELSMALRDYAEQLSVTNRSDEALPLIQESLQLNRRELGAPHESIVLGLLRLGVVYNNLFRVDEALEAFESALAMTKTLDSVDDKIVLLIKADMAVTLDNAGRLAEATSMQEEVIELTKTLYGPDDPNLGISLGNLAISYLRQSDYQRAYERSAESVILTRAVLPADHDQQIARLDLHVATLMHVNRFTEMEEALDTLDELVREQHGQVSYRGRLALYRRGMTQDYRRQYEEALRSYRRAYEIAVETEGVGGGAALFHGAYYARAAMRVGDLATAEPLLRDALTREDELFFGHLMEAKKAMIELLSKSGRHAEAESLLDKTLITLTEAAGDKRGGLVDIYAIGADHYRRKSDLPMAKTFVDEALAITRQYHEDNDVDAAKGLLAAAEFYDASGDAEVAMDLFSEYYDRTSPLFGVEEASVRRAGERLGR